MSGVTGLMKQSQVTVPWKEGLHMRAAARLVFLGMKFRSKVVLKCGEKVAELRSVLSVLALCAFMGTTLEVEVTGDDEQDAMRAIEAEFNEGKGAGGPKDQA